VPENEKLKVFPGKLQLISSASGTEAPRLEIDANAYREKVEASIPLCLCDPNSKLLKHLKLQKRGGQNPHRWGKFFENCFGATTSMLKFSNCLSD